MDSRIVDRNISCPFCAASMNILLDLSAGDQSYIEDCQICCQPMQISFVAGHDSEIQESTLDELRVERAN